MHIALTIQYFSSWQWNPRWYGPSLFISNSVQAIVLILEKLPKLEYHVQVKAFVSDITYLYSWAVTWVKIPSDICAQGRLKECQGNQPAFPHSLSSLRCPNEEFCILAYPKMHSEKILIWLREYTSWSESSLGTHIRRYRIYCMYSDRQAWANSVDPDGTPQNAAFHLCLHCLPLIQQFLDTTSGSKLYLFK